MQHGRTNTGINLLICSMIHILDYLIWNMIPFIIYQIVVIATTGYICSLNLASLHLLKQCLHLNNLMNEWMNEWMGEWMSEWMNKYMNVKKGGTSV